MCVKTVALDTLDSLNLRIQCFKVTTVADAKGMVSIISGTSL